MGVYMCVHVYVYVCSVCVCTATVHILVATIKWILKCQTRYRLYLTGKERPYQGVVNIDEEVA